MTTAESRMPDMGAQIIAWCGALAVARVLPVSDSPRKKLVGMAIGGALLVLARLMETKRPVAAGGGILQGARRLLTRT